MTITRRHQTGFETGDTIYEQHGFNPGGAFTISSTSPNTSTYCGVVTGDNSNNILIAIPSTAQMRMGIWMRQNGVGAGDSPEVCLFRNLTVQAIRLTWNGTQFELFAGATSLGTHTPTWTANTYMHIGLDVKIDAASGWATLYFNGVAVISHSGQTNQGSTAITNCIFGSNVSNQTWAATAAIDDLYIDDTTGEGATAVVPMKRFYYVLPNGNGNYSQFDGSDGNQTDNYQLVDEVPVNESTDYVSTSTAAERDSYAMAACPALTGEVIVAVIPQAITRNMASAGVCTLFTRLGSTDLDGASQAIAVDWMNTWERQTTKPGGGGWTATDVDNMEVGILNS